MQLYDVQVCVCNGKAWERETTATATATASVKASSACELLAIEEEEHRVQMEWNGMPSCANNNTNNFWNSFFCAFNL